MKWAYILVLAFVSVSVSALQDELATLKVEVPGAFVWGEDFPSGAVSSTIRDPITGNEIRKLNYAGVDVSSRVGFERSGSGANGTLLAYTVTVVNNTGSQISVRYGGISVDGHAASPLSVISSTKRSKQERKDKNEVVRLSNMYCFKNGFLSRDDVFPDQFPSQLLTVGPGAAIAVSSLVRDPRGYPLRCSVEGCYPTGTMRYYVTVNSHDYVFVQPGRSATYCGK